mmetsp:Transcript_19497/g.48761  ORF Transcript_19497/g.48761 Transcript_19497/m.48761 type:complete len:219 (-) Transcript_19497:1858-2514(-)
MLLDLAVDDLEEISLRQFLGSFVLHGGATHAVEDVRLQRREELRDLAATEAVQTARRLVQSVLAHHVFTLRLLTDGCGYRRSSSTAWSRKRGLLGVSRLTLLASSSVGFLLGGRFDLSLGRPAPDVVERLGDVLVEIQLDHGLTSIQVWKPELDCLIQSVQDRAIQVSRSVRRNHHHELRGRGAGVVEDRVQRVAQRLAHACRPAPRGEEGVRLIDKQ